MGGSPADSAQSGKRRPGGGCHDGRLLATIGGCKEAQQRGSLPEVHARERSEERRAGRKVSVRALRRGKEQEERRTYERNREKVSDSQPRDVGLDEARPGDCPEARATRGLSVAEDEMPWRQRSRERAGRGPREGPRMTREDRVRHDWTTITASPNREGGGRPTRSGSTTGDNEGGGSTGGLLSRRRRRASPRERIGRPSSLASRPLPRVKELMRHHFSLQGQMGQTEEGLPLAELVPRPAILARAERKCPAASTKAPVLSERKPARLCPRPTRRPAVVRRPRASKPGRMPLFVVVRACTCAAFGRGSAGGEGLASGERR